MAARSRRRIRFRTTAFPTLRVTVKPIRTWPGWPAPGLRSIVKPLAENRKPADAALKSARFFKVVKQKGGVPGWVTLPSFKPKGIFNGSCTARGA